MPARPWLAGREYCYLQINLRSHTDTAAGFLSHPEIESELSRLCASAADVHRLRRWAERRAHNLPGCTGEDLLQEAMCKFLAGERVWKRSVPAFIAVALVIRSISSNIRKSASVKAINPNVQVDAEQSGDVEDGNMPMSVDATDYRTPADGAEAKSSLLAISKSLEGDEDVELVAMAWMDGLRGKEAAEAAGLDEKKYDAARKRLMRKLDEFRPNKDTA